MRAAHISHGHQTLSVSGTVSLPFYCTATSTVESRNGYYTLFTAQMLSRSITEAIYASTALITLPRYIDA